MAAGDDRAARQLPRGARVLVALAGAPRSEHLIREAARLARGEGLPLVGVHVRLPGLAGPASAAEHRRLLDELGGHYQEVHAPTVADGIRRVADDRFTYLVLGVTNRPRWRRLLGDPLLEQVGRLPNVEVHRITQDRSDTGPGPARRYRPPPLSHRRLVTAWALVILGVPVLTAALVPFRTHEVSTTALPLYVLLTAATAAVGGAAPALTVAVTGFLAVNWFLTPPFHTLVVAAAPNLTALITFLVVGAVVSFLVGQVSLRSAEAARARREAESLVAAATSLLEVSEPMAPLLDRTVSLLNLDGAAILAGNGSGWRTVLSSGWRPPTSPADATTTIPLGPGRILAVAGPPHGGDERRLLDAFAAQTATALERRDLQEEAAQAAALAETDRLRTALLRAVSHDLRTPLASIKASVSSLRQGDVIWPPDAVAHFLATIEEEADRLDRVVGNLLDMGRLQAGAVRVVPRPSAPEEVVLAALTSLSIATDRVVVHLDEHSPSIQADPALLERAIANIISNALAWSPPTTEVTVDVVSGEGMVGLRVIDRGPGVPVAARGQLFEPFHRLGDRSNDTGAGLGLAVAKGFVQAMGGTIDMSDTPGGGLTLVITLARSQS